LYYRGRMTKIQLIEENIHEKSTGMEILKRLLKLELIQQADNEEDRRSKWVFISEKGATAMAAIQQQMYALTTTISGNLNATELQQLNQLLQKLDLFHQKNMKG
jgi:MarR family transcriptional regulator, lower aerobic nicotinate degradation pathway regulator